MASEENEVHERQRYSEAQRRALEPQAEPVVERLEALLGERRAQDVLAQRLASTRVVGLCGGGGVKGQAAVAGAQARDRTLGAGA